MSAFNPAIPKILLAVGGEQLRARIQQTLGDSRTVCTNENTPGEERFDLIITDHADCVTEMRDGGQATGIILIGAGEADVVLPTDVSQRELLNCCSMLAEIVCLRRANIEAVSDRQALRQQTLTDPLTQLANRRGWDEAVRHGAQCVALLDLDHFARINDTDGHPAGDDVLRHCGQALLGNLRSTDFVARLGGDEFAVLIDADDRHSAHGVCERLRSQLAATLATATPYRITASVGCCWSEDVNADSEQLYAQASDALKRAKANGRDQTVMA